MIKYNIVDNIITGSDGIKRKFKFKEVEPDNMYYHAQTSDEVIEILETARIYHVRLRLYYGDINTGLDWEEEFWIRGYVGKSTGSKPIPLLVYNDRSYGGSAILDHCVVKIEASKGKKLLYIHPSYHKKSDNEKPNIEAKVITNK